MKLSTFWYIKLNKRLSVLEKEHEETGKSIMQLRQVMKEVELK